MENNNRRKLGTYQICLIALAIVMNVIGGQIALALRLPIYLDSIGTIMIGAMLGPWCGLIPGLLGGLIMAFTGDIYSLYFAPVGMIVGFMSGLAHTGFSGLRGGAKLQRILSLGHIITVKDAAIRNSCQRFYLHSSFWRTDLIWLCNSCSISGCKDTAWADSKHYSCSVFN